MTFKAAIFTAKETETVALKKQLVGPYSQRKTSRHEVYTVWKIRQSDNDQPAREDLDVAVYETGRGQEKAAIFCPAVVESFKPDVVLFLGCAGGEPYETNKGDVYVASHVWPYEKAKVNYRDVKSKAHPLEPDRAIFDQARVVSDFGTWRRRISDGAPNEAIVRFRPLASGEKVIVHDQSAAWKYIKKNLDNEISAVETEGHGFLASVTPLKTYALMIRGISDNLVDKNIGGPDADDHNQQSATANAAAFAVQVLLEIDYDVLRGNKAKTVIEQGEPDLESVTIRFKATPEDIAKIVVEVRKVTNSPVVIEKADEGSITLVLSMGSKAAALMNALHDRRCLQYFFDEKIIDFAASIVNTREPIFDDYLALLRGKTSTPRRKVIEAVSKEYPDWAKHLAFLERKVRSVKIRQAASAKSSTAARRSRSSRISLGTRGKSARVSQRSMRAVARLTQLYNKDVRPVIEISTRLLGTMPARVADQIRNAFDHQVKILEATYSTRVSTRATELNIERARLHFATAKYYALNSMLGYYFRVMTSAMRQLRKAHNTVEARELGKLRRELLVRTRRPLPLRSVRKSNVRLIRRHNEAIDAANARSVQLLDSCEMQIARVRRHLEASVFEKITNNVRIRRRLLSVGPQQ